MQIKEIKYTDIILNKEDIDSMISNYIEDRGIKFKDIEVIKTNWDVYGDYLDNLKIRIND